MLLLENLVELIEDAREAFRMDSSYAVQIAQQASAVRSRSQHDH